MARVQLHLSALSARPKISPPVRRRDPDAVHRREPVCQFDGRHSGRRMHRVGVGYPPKRSRSIGKPFLLKERIHLFPSPRTPQHEDHPPNRSQQFARYGLEDGNASRLRDAVRACQRSLLDAFHGGGVGGCPTAGQRHLAAHKPLVLRIKDQPLNDAKPDRPPSVPVVQQPVFVVLSWRLSLRGRRKNEGKRRQQAHRHSTARLFPPGIGPAEFHDQEALARQTHSCRGRIGDATSSLPGILRRQRTPWVGHTWSSHG